MVGIGEVWTFLALDSMGGLYGWDGCICGVRIVWC